MRRTLMLAVLAAVGTIALALPAFAQSTRDFKAEFNEMDTCPGVDLCGKGVVHGFGTVSHDSGLHELCPRAWRGLRVGVRRSGADARQRRQHAADDGVRNGLRQGDRRDIRDPRRNGRLRGSHGRRHALGNDGSSEPGPEHPSTRDDHVAVVVRTTETRRAGPPARWLNEGSRRWRSGGWRRSSRCAKAFAVCASATSAGRDGRLRACEQSTHPRRRRRRCTARRSTPASSRRCTSSAAPSSYDGGGRRPLATWWLHGGTSGTCWRGRRLG